jgi:hypothetical protein
MIGLHALCRRHQPCGALSITMRRQTAVVTGTLVVGLFASMANACGGDSPATPVPNPAPVPAPAPQAPSLVGGWAGVFTAVTVERQSGRRTSNTCNESWIVTTQTGGRFSGTFQLSGGTAITCAQSGTFFGSVSTNGALSGLTHSVMLGSLPCSRISGDGTLNGFASSITVTAQATDVVRCTNVFTYEADRTLTLAMNKR